MAMVGLDDSLMWWRVESREKDNTINYSSLLADLLASWVGSAQAGVLYRIGHCSDLEGSSPALYDL